MLDLELILRGARPEGGIEELALALQDCEIKLTPRPVERDVRADQKTADPVAVASLALSIPGAALAVWDLAERIRKRSRAKALIEAANRLRSEQCIEVLAVSVEGTTPLADLDPDAVLELVNAPEGETKD